MVRSPSAAWLQPPNLVPELASERPVRSDTGDNVVQRANAILVRRIQASGALAAGVTGLQPHPLRVLDISTLAHRDEGRRYTVEGSHPSFQLAQGIGPANRMFRGRTRFRAIQWRVISGARRARDQHGGQDDRDRHPTQDFTSKLGPRDVLVEAQTFGKQAQSALAASRLATIDAAA